MTSSDGVRETLAPVLYFPGVKPFPRAELVADPPLATPSDDDEFDDDVDPAGGWDTACAELESESVIRSAEAEGDLEAAHLESAYLAGIRALGRRGLSRRELERALRSRDFTDGAVTTTAERLEREGVLDDVGLAQHVVGSLQERKGLGRSAIAAELAKRMFAPAAIEYALELVDAGDELARARDLAMKRAPQLRSFDHETAVRRLSAYLARRGYSGSAIRAAVEQALPRTAGSVRFI